MLLVCIYVLGFFLGRFFPYESQEDMETDLLPVQELEVETPISTQKKNVKVEKVDFHDIQWVTSPQWKKDNLQLLEWIGPKIQDLLYAHEVYSFEQLASCSTQELNDILEKGGDRFTLWNPSTWPYQAQLASEKNWGKLKEYQDFLMRGVES